MVVKLSDFGQMDSQSGLRIAAETPQQKKKQTKIVPIPVRAEYILTIVQRRRYDWEKQTRIVPDPANAQVVHIMSIGPRGKDRVPHRNQDLVEVWG